MTDARIREIYTALKSGMPYITCEEALELIDEIRQLNATLQQREKCSYIGAMRDCPTHGVIQRERR